MEIQLISTQISLSELAKLAHPEFPSILKAVVDTRQEIMAVGGELHADEEVFLFEQSNSKREDVWGINLYLEKTEADFIEYDSMINLKPGQKNMSRGVEYEATRDKIATIVSKLVDLGSSPSRGG